MCTVQYKAFRVLVVKKKNIEKGEEKGREGEEKYDGRSGTFNRRFDHGMSYT